MVQFSSVAAGWRMSDNDPTPELVALLELSEKCRYCGKPMESPVSMSIIDRGWNPSTRKQYVRTQSLKFCDDKCGSHYQMGCEG
ncbi:MAG: hypothetical protein ACTS5I_10140 [Rhodanobacter sp.]